MIEDLFFTEKQKALKELTRKIALEYVLPKRAYYDETEEFPWDLVKIFGEAGLFGCYIPEEYGGEDGGDCGDVNCG
jgi:butyryl-CoA dehydrogenase